ncbi:hypothetical protein BDF20DRAFT_867265 [Mycotypha africana]|uniref:uncharacterized protein n=1 Tax=Mycotypha africana TaxID=64632 RepID=UPI002300B27E|nr:uncharacterized protein BDF20DRAFT_867265 [Mycotypha africana]KAI8982491.1 hypothetical protein BDF20DRAFT_867265 [Mycotypha africana]
MSFKKFTRRTREEDPENSRGVPVTLRKEIRQKNWLQFVYVVTVCLRGYSIFLWLQSSFSRKVSRFWLQLFSFFIGDCLQFIFNLNFSRYLSKGITKLNPVSF